MLLAISVFTCREPYQEGRPVGTAQIRQSPNGRRILQVQMEALPIDGCLCIALEDVLILAHEAHAEDGQNCPAQALH